MMVIEASPMDEQSKQIEIKRVPMRKLLASIKQDIRKTIQASPTRKLQKKK
jgi:hypothetical protein